MGRRGFPKLFRKAGKDAAFLAPGRSSPLPRQRTRIHHPLSSYVPFFVFVGTLVIIVLVIIWLVGRLLSMMPGPGARGVMAPPTATVGAIVATPSAPAAPRTAGPTTGGVKHHQPKPGLATVVFAQGHDPNGNPVAPSRVFTSTVPRVYAFVTLHGVAAGAAVRFVWTYGPRSTTLNDVSEHHNGPAYATHMFSSFYFPDTGPFPTGVYTVSVALASRPMAQGSFRVRTH